MRVKRVEITEVDVPGLGDRIKRAREASGKSISALAREAGISRNYWYQLEAETIHGSLVKETLDKVEQALGVSFNVFGDSDSNA